MNYPDTLKYMYERLPMFHREGKTAYKASLDNINKLDEYLNYPHHKFKSIHIAGTNGKGSVSHYLASILQSAGYKTGLYTSPHLKDFRERIKINGQMIPENEVCSFVEKHIDVFEKIQPSFFEMTVGMAFDYFAREKVDFAVIETGLGGRLDSTNIIKPLVSVITNISFDHTDLLGDSLPLIAHEKAGIIKMNVPVVIGETHAETSQVFLDKAKTESAQIRFADQVYSVDYSTIELSAHGNKDFKQIFNIYKGDKLIYQALKSDLTGIYQRKNILTVLATVDILNENDIKIGKESIYEGVACAKKQTGLLGRWQTIGYNPLVICDTGHNEGGIRQVIEQIAGTPYKTLHFIFGIVKDKNIEPILELLPKNAIYYFTKAKIPRALDENTLAEKAAQFGLEGKTYPTVAEALEDAKKKADKNDLIFIGGSTFVVAEVI